MTFQKIQLDTKEFIPGKQYATRLITNYDSIITFTIIKRTAKTVTIIGDLIPEPKTFKVSTKYSEFEQIKPWGSYSFAPVIGADDIVA